MENKITPEMIKALEDASKKEDEFWERHKIPGEKDTRLTGQATPAHRAWVRAVEREYSLMPKDHGRVMLDTPIARKAFILGFNSKSEFTNQELFEKDREH